jgi:hypothetical protein
MMIAFDDYVNPKMMTKCCCHCRYLLAKSSKPSTAMTTTLKYIDKDDMDDARHNNK